MSFVMVAINYPTLRTVKSKLEFTFKMNNFFVFVLGLTGVILVYSMICRAETVFVAHMYFVFDFYSSAIKLAIVLTTMLILFSSYDYLYNVTRVRIEYPVLVVFSMLFLFLLTSSYNFVSMFISIVGFSLNLYVLLLLDKHPAAREAGIKYFYLSTYSTGLLLFGIFLIYFIFHSTNFFILKMASQKAIVLTSPFLSNLTFMAITFLIMGLFFKLAAFPCH